MASLEEATEAQLPYGMGSVDLTNPVAVLVVVTALVAGMTIWNMADSIGASFAARINSFIANLTGSDVGGASGGTTFGGD